MKRYRFIISLLIILIPTISFGQLFPSISDFNGEIERVVEKRYGKEVYLFNRLTGIYMPRCYSGWKYVYHLDTNARLIRRTNFFKGKVQADYIYKFDSTEKVIHKREIVNDTVTNHNGDYIEDEFLLDSEGKIEKVNIWSFKSTDSLKKIIAVEKDVQYDSLNNIISFYRTSYDRNGNEINGNLYVIFYDSKSRVAKVEEKAIGTKPILVETENNGKTFKDIPISEPELLKEWIYHYDPKGLLISYTLKHYGELHKSDSNGGKDYKLFFKYDDKNNWIKTYHQLGNSRKRLIAKRRIEYK